MHAFMDRMDAVGIANATVVRGVPHECGLLGLILAHIAALQQCWASSWVESCLIMEDDFAMRLPPATAISLIDSFLLDVQSWDVLMLSCNAQQYMNHDGRGTGRHDTRSASCAACLQPGTSSSGRTRPR